VIFEFLLAITAVLLCGTSSALVLYYRRIKELNTEYSQAKSVVEDVVIGVNTEFQRQREKVLLVAQKIETVSLETKKVAEKLKDQEVKLTELAEVVEGPHQIEEKISARLKEIENEVKGLKAVQERVTQKLGEIEKVKRERYASDVKIEAAIPIKKEKALEPLTETELQVLEIIGKEGEKTAPEIRERIGLTREHTARLMKKLYKDGYLERDTHKMPYVYRLKEEMEKLLKRREANTS